MKTAIVESKGIRIHVRIDQPDGGAGIINEVIDGDTYGAEALSKIIINPEVILDVGGQIGTFGLLAKKYWPDALLIAVEADFEHYLLYCRNMQENDCKNYYILNRALVYGRKIVDMHWGHTTRSKEDTEMCLARGECIYRSNVPTITVEEIVNAFDIKKISLAKWDCEGCEIGAFKNMLDSSASIFEYMVGEYHIYDDKGRHLQGGEKQYSDFVNMAKAKFPHLSFSLPEQGGVLGRFYASPIQQEGA